MRFIVLLIAFLLPAFADNSVTISSESGSGCSGCTFKIARYFGRGEIADYPRPRVDGTSASYWQTEVKTRWDDGSVRFAVIYLEATISGTGSITADFVNDSSPAVSSTEMTREDMLGFNTGGGTASWGCKIRTTAGGAAIDTSCREMLANNHYQVLESGPLATTVLIREGPDSVAAGATRNFSFGYVCTSDCTAPYASSSWEKASSESFKSMRPSFVVTFYRRWKRVRTHYVLDNGWTDRLQDQRFLLALFNGGGETNQIYDSSVEVVLPARSRIVEEGWSTAPNSYSLDLGTQYMESTKVIPEFGNLTIGSQAIALEKAAFDATDKGATVGASAPHLGWGQWTRSMGAGGGRPDLGLFPRWSARLLNSWHKDLWTVVLGNAKAMMHAPFFYLEYDDARNYCGTNDCELGAGTVTAFGRPISNDARPDLLYHANPAYVPTNALPDPVGTVTVTGASCIRPYTTTAWDNPVNRWQMEMAHPPEPFFVPYLVTGDYIYLEALQAWAQYRMLLNRGQEPPASTAYDHWGSKGILNDLEARGIAWPLRDLLHAALMSTDGTPEKEYFEEKLFNNLAWMEGKLAITNGEFYPLWGEDSCVATPTSFNSETNIWCAGHRWFAKDQDNPLKFAVLRRSLPSTEGVNGDTVWTASRLWMDNYWRVVMGHAAELYPEAIPIAQAAGETLLHLIKDSNYNLLFQVAAYNIPAQSGQNTYIGTYADLRAGYALTATLARELSSGATTIYLTGILNDFWTIHSATLSVFDVDSERVYRTSYSSSAIQDSCTVDPETDVFTCAGHPFQNGDIVKLVATSAPDGATNGSDYRIDVLTGDTVKLCTSSACSSYVDVTSSGSEVKLGMMSFDIARGYKGTSKAAHSAGAKVTYTGRTLLGGSVAHNYGMIFRAALSFAVGQGISTIDEGTGTTITAQSAFDTLDAALSSTERFGSNTNCSGVGLNDVNECDNPAWGFYPRVVETPELRITTSTLPTGVQGVPYSGTLSATNGQSPYTWDLAGGALCTGLVLGSTGTISGVPSQAGQCSFVARVTDTNNAVATRELEITIGRKRSSTRIGRGDGTLR